MKRLTKESISNGKTADTYSYEYDDYGNRSKMVANGSEEYETVYDYTVNGKYTALLQKEIKTVEETSNATISDGLAISPTDLITSTAADAKTEETAYSYDANGNQITKTAESKTETNTYDGLNQLIGFTDGETTASYKYNADGLRTSKTVDGKTINHIWDGNKQIVVDMDDSDWYSAEVYVRGTNLLAKFSKQSGNVKTDYQYYTQNAHGDVVNLTDSTGAITKSYKYDAFGVEQNVDDADDNAFRYCGEYFDAETGTIYLRARYYQASIGRFISRDSYAGKNENPLSLNLYTYCANNPIVYVDPSGHNPIFLIAAVVCCAALLTGCSKIDNSTVPQTNASDETGTTSQVATSTGTTTGTTTTTEQKKSTPTTISSAGIELLKSFEAYRANPYIASTWETNYTIGYGHVIQDGGTSVVLNGKAYSSLTEEQATELLIQDLNNTFVSKFNDFLSENDIYLTQAQYDACIMDSFQKGQNIWGNDYSVSNYILNQNYSSYEECLQAFLANTENEGLINRRTQEANLFYYGY